MTYRLRPIEPSIPRQRTIEAEQVRILLEPTRRRIVDLLNDGPATVTELAIAFAALPVRSHATAISRWTRASSRW